MLRGQFIVVEGICGAGKSTVAEQLVNKLSEMGLEAIYNHGACTYTETGRKLKELSKELPGDFSTAYYLADLVQDSLRTIRPLLDRGVYVVQDRYVDSITSYICALSRFKNQKMDIKPVVDLYTELELLLQPDLSIWCKAPHAVILERLICADETETQRRKYVKTPELIDLVQEEFERLTRERMEKGNAVIVSTDELVDMEKLLQKLHIGKAKSVSLTSR